MSTTLGAPPPTPTLPLSRKLLHSNSETLRGTRDQPLTGGIQTTHGHSSHRKPSREANAFQRFRSRPCNRSRSWPRTSLALLMLPTHTHPHPPTPLTHTHTHPPHPPTCPAPTRRPSVTSVIAIRGCWKARRGSSLLNLPRTAGSVVKHRGATQPRQSRLKPRNPLHAKVTVVTRRPMERAVSRFPRAMCLVQRGGSGIRSAVETLQT